MLLYTLSVSVVLLTLIGVCPAQEVPVISAVFMARNISVDYEGAKTACALQYSRLATLDEITIAYRNGYEYCQWGWIKEQRIVMLRLNPTLPCASYNLGILKKDCPNVYLAFCINNTGSVINVPISRSRVASYENATLACKDSGFTLATAPQIEQQLNTTNISINGLAWYDSGVGQIVQNQNGSFSFSRDVCSDTTSHVAAFCYNPTLKDVVIVNNTKTVKIIIMACLLALIFIILLFAALCMKGNKFICCMGKEHTQPADIVQAPVPNWNKTSTYRRYSHLNNPYNKAVNFEKRPPVIRPDMMNYRTHYTNMGYDATGEE